MKLVLEKDEVLEMLADAIEDKPCKLKLPAGMVIWGGKMVTGGAKNEVVFDMVTVDRAVELEAAEAAENGETDIAKRFKAGDDKGDD